LNSPFWAAFISGRHAIRAGQVDVEVHGQQRLEIRQVAFVDGVDQHLRRFRIFLALLRLQAGRQRLGGVIEHRQGHHGDQGDQHRGLADAERGCPLLRQVGADRQQEIDQEKEKPDIQEQGKHDHQAQHGHQQALFDAYRFEGRAWQVCHQGHGGD
jgi:hypothetical protein